MDNKKKKEEKVKKLGDNIVIDFNRYNSTELEKEKRIKSLFKEFGLYLSSKEKTKFELKSNGEFILLEALLWEFNKYDAATSLKKYAARELDINMYRSTINHNLHNYLYGKKISDIKVKKLIKIII